MFSFRKKEKTGVMRGGGDARTSAVGDPSRQDAFQLARWQAIVEAMPYPTVVLDGGDHIVRYNNSMPDLFKGARTGIAISRVTRNPELNTALENVRKTGETVVVQMLERVPVERRISATVSKLRHMHANKKSEPDLLICFQDHSEQDRLAQMRSDFVANASHELRTPLASLSGLVDTLRGPARNDSQAQDRFLDLMATQADRMKRLIDDLLSLSRVEMRAHLPPHGIVNLAAVVSEVVQLFEPLSEASSIHLDLVKPEESVTIRGDREEITQVVQNLIHNAIKYGREGGHIRVAVGISQDAVGEQIRKMALVEIADDGIGIAAHHLPRLTERFYRANVEASRDKGGTGLGLAIVKHIVARHQGALRISSELGEGSKFTVSFEML